MKSISRKVTNKGQLRAYYHLPSAKMAMTFRPRSRLEFRAALFFEANHEVHSYYFEPNSFEINIEYRRQVYTPDFCVNFRNNRAPTYFEIKQLSKLSNAEVLAKLGAFQLAKPQGHEFEILTEQFLTLQLERNLLYLLRHSRSLLPGEVRAQALEYLKKKRQVQVFEWVETAGGLPSALKLALNLTFLGEAFFNFQKPLDAYSTVSVLDAA